jgi:hypothetical protein
MAACPAIFAKKIKRFAEAAENHGFWKDEKYRCVAVSINNRRDIFFRWKSITGQSYWIRKNPKTHGSATENIGSTADDCPRFRRRLTDRQTDKRAAFCDFNNHVFFSSRPRQKPLRCPGNSPPLVFLPFLAYVVATCPAAPHQRHCRMGTFFY